MGTVNYGAFGVMMKLCHDYLPASQGAAIGSELFGSIERYIAQLQASGQTIGQDVGGVVRMVVETLLAQLGVDLPEARGVIDRVIQYVINDPARVRRRGTSGAAGDVTRALVDAAVAALFAPARPSVARSDHVDCSPVRR
jgi:hypothetical protein